MPAKRKRVLLITPQPFFQWRGSPIRVSFNCLALSESGYEVDLLCLPFGEERDTPGVRIVRVGPLPGCRTMPIGPSIWKVPFDLKLWWRARQLIEENAYDVIHAVEDAGVMAVSLARRSGAKWVFEKHSDPRSYRRGWLRNGIMWLYGKVESYAIRRADAVIATGQGLVEQAADTAPRTPAYHIFDIASSLVEPDREQTAQRRVELQRTDADVLITYVGSFAVYQGIELLFNAIPVVAQKEPRARFVIIGGTPDEIAERRRSLGAAAAAVVFVGPVPPDELPNYLAASDVLLSSRVAGANTPLKLLDYLKAGRCILATDIQANRLILDETSAYFVEPHSAAFADGIQRLVNDAALRETLAAAGKTLIRNTYNYSEFKRRLLAVYDGLLAVAG